MPNITNSLEIKRAIELCELEQSENTKLLREEFNQALEAVSSSGSIGRTLINSTTGMVTKNLFRASTAIVVGFILRKLFINSSGSVFKKLLFAAIEVGLTREIGQYTNVIKSIGAFIFRRILPSKK